MAEIPAAVSFAGTPSPVPGISRNIWWLGVTSFCTDISSEMLYPLIPIFVTAVLGAPALALGVIEGVAEGTAGFLKLGSGWLSDRLGRRRRIVIAGYALSAVAKPILAAASVWGTVLFARFVDRFGAGGLWTWAGPGAAFFYGAAAAAAAVLMLVLWSPDAERNPKDGEMAA